jgi:hypothetical protein
VHGLVDAADRLLRLFPEDAEEDGLDLAGRRAGQVEGRTAEAEFRCIRRGNGLLERRLALRVHHTADIGSAGLGQQLDRTLDVAVGELAVPVDPDDDVVRGGRDAEIQRVRVFASGLSTTRIRGSSAASVGDLPCPVLLGPTATITSSSPG